MSRDVIDRHKRAEQLKVSVTNKQIVTLAAPIALALFIPQLNFLTNTAFLGRLGERELGVNGLTGVFYLIFAMIGYGLSSGMQIQMARRAGEGDNKGLSHIFSNGMMVALMFALALMLLALWLVPLVFGLSLHDDANIMLCINYLYIRVWGLPFLLLGQLCNSFYISIHKSRFLIYGSVAATASNILFDYLLIFGKAGFPQMGLEGAAIASVISEVVLCATLYALFYFHRFYITYPAFRDFKFDMQLSRRTLKVAAPLIVQFMFSIGGWQVFFIFVEHLGEKELAASQILRSVLSIVGVVTWSFATTCNTMVSNIIGQGKQDEVIPLIWKIIKFSFLSALTVGIILLVFSDQFLSMYRDDPALVAFATPSLRIIVFATLIMAISTVVFNGVVGTGNTLVNLTMEVFCVCSYLVYCYIVIERMRSSLAWCWGSEVMYWTSLILVSSAYLKSGRWKGKRI